VIAQLNDRMAGMSQEQFVGLARGVARAVRAVTRGRVATGLSLTGGKEVSP
jgi:hypothetical protein